MASVVPLSLQSAPRHPRLSSVAPGRSPILSPPTSGDAKKRVFFSPSCRAMSGMKFKGTKMWYEDLSDTIEKKYQEKKEACEGNGGSYECAKACFELERLCGAMADLRWEMDRGDPYEYYCSENPEADECQIICED